MEHERTLDSTLYELITKGLMSEQRYTLKVMNETDIKVGDELKLNEAIADKYTGNNMTLKVVGKGTMHPDGEDGEICKGTYLTLAERTLEDGEYPF